MFSREKTDCSVPEYLQDKQLGIKNKQTNYVFPHHYEHVSFSCMLFFPIIMSMCRFHVCCFYLILSYIVLLNYRNTAKQAVRYPKWKFL